MKIHFLSSLRDSTQTGGASLRNRALTHLYESAGLEVLTHYVGALPLAGGLSAILRARKYGFHTRTMFRTAHTSIPCGDFYHFDHLRHFSWNLNQNIPIIYNAHNLEFENFFSRNDCSTKALAFAEYELDCMSKTHLTLVCSKRERDVIISKRPQLAPKIFVFPNLVDSNLYFSHPHKKYVSFIGTLDYLPNIEAVELLCREILPALSPSIREKYRFLVAGKSPVPEIITLLEQSDVTLVANVSDAKMKEFFSQTKVLVVPILKGSGTRLKILEALFSGAEVLSTPLGREGIDSPLITTASVAEFANKLEELLAARPDENQAPSMSDLKQMYDTKEWVKQNLNDFVKLLTSA